MPHAQGPHAQGPWGQPAADAGTRWYRAWHVRRRHKAVLAGGCRCTLILCLLALGHAHITQHMRHR